MNNQALVRARCMLRANKLVCRPKEPITAGVQNLMSTTQLMASPQHHHHRLAFSSVAQEPSSTNDRRPSALEQANLDVITPGHSISVLQKYAANGAALIRQSDFVKLCESARPGKKKDAKVIATALKEFRRNNRFVLQKVGARAAVEGMMRACVPNYKVLYGKPRLHAAIFVADQIIDEKTGLYFAVETELVDQVLSEIQQALTEMEEKGMQLKIEIKEKASGDEDEDEKLLYKTLRATEGLVKVLVKRSCRPEFNMKKRAARQYSKRLQTVAGPELSTLKLATDISLSIGGAAVAQSGVVGPYAAAWWTKGVVDDSILTKIADAESLEQQEAAAAAEDANSEDDSEAEADDGDEGEDKDEKE